MAIMTARGLDDGPRRARAVRDDRLMEAGVRAIPRSAVRPPAVVSWFDRARAAASGAVFDGGELDGPRGDDMPRAERFGLGEASV
jgi:plasmid stability protein